MCYNGLEKGQIQSNISDKVGNFYEHFYTRNTRKPKKAYGPCSGGHISGQRNPDFRQID